MKVLFHSTTCTTCQRILKDWKPGRDVVLRDIKSEPITPKEVDLMAKLSGSYESLFSRIAIKYRGMGLNKKKLTEKDYRKYIMQEYTFLKRPVLILGDQIFIGNSPKNVAVAKKALQSG